MDRFEFVMVLLSIIIGLGIGGLLTNVARQIRAGSKCKGFWVHSGVVAALFLAFLQMWWESWGLQRMDVWTFPLLLLMLVPPSGLFIISHLIYPNKLEGADLESYYFAKTQLIWSVAALTVVVATLFYPIAFGDQLIQMDNLASLFMLVLCVLLAKSRLRALHLGALPVVLVIMVLDIMIFRPVI